MEESHKLPKYNMLKFSELRKKWANGEIHFTKLGLLFNSFSHQLLSPGEKERENGLYKQDIQQVKLYSILEDRKCEVIFDHGHILQWGLFLMQKYGLTY
jgi:hypothetical protein